MKKLIVVLTSMGIIVGSIAMVSLASSNKYHDEKELDYNNRFNGSYYYDIAWSKTHVYEGYVSSVTVSLKKNGSWQADNTTFVNGGSTLTCYSQKIQGSGSTRARSIICDFERVS